MRFMLPAFLPALLAAALRASLFAARSMWPWREVECLTCSMRTLMRLARIRFLMRLLQTTPTARRVTV